MPEDAPCLARGGELLMQNARERPPCAGVLYSGKGAVAEAEIRPGRGIPPNLCDFQDFSENNRQLQAFSITLLDILAKIRKNTLEPIFRHPACPRGVSDSLGL